MHNIFELADKSEAEEYSEIGKCERALNFERSYWDTNQKFDNIMLHKKSEKYKQL